MLRNQKKDIFLGRLSVFGASLCWACELIFFRLDASKLSTFSFQCTRNVIIVLGAFVALGVTGKLRALRQVSRKQMRWMGGVIVLASFVADIGFYYALPYVPVVNGLVIGHTQPFFILLVGWLVWREQPLGSLQILGGSVMFVAAILVSSGSWASLSRIELGAAENLLIVVSAVFWAAATVITKHYHSEMPGLVYIVFRFAGGLLALIPLALISGGLEFTWFVFANALSVLLGMALYLQGLKRLSAVEVGFLELFSPLFGLLLGNIVLGEGATAFQVLGSLAMFIGFGLLIDRPVHSAATPAAVNGNE